MYRRKIGCMVRRSVVQSKKWSRQRRLLFCLLSYSTRHPKCPPTAPRCGKLPSTIHIIVTGRRCQVTNDDNIIITPWSLYFIITRPTRLPMQTYQFEFGADQKYVLYKITTSFQTVLVHICFWILDSKSVNDRHV